MQHGESYRRLSQFIESEKDSLFRTFCFFVFKSGLASGQAIAEMAEEILHDVVVEALTHAGRFDPSRPPRPWLRKIAVHMIKRRQAENVRRFQHEVAADAEFFEDVMTNIVTDGDEDSEHLSAIQKAFYSLSESDQHIIRLWVIHDLNGESLASALRVTPGTARVRLHRALDRLRQAVQARLNDPPQSPRRSRTDD